MERPRKTVPSASTSTAASILDVIFPADTESGRGSRPSRSIEAGIIRAVLSQAKHVEHVVQAGGLLPQPLRRAHRPVGVGHAALGADGKLEPLADARKERGVLADDVAAADRMEADRLGRPLARITFPAVYRDLLQVALQRLGDH